MRFILYTMLYLPHLQLHQNWNTRLVWSRRRRSRLAAALSSRSTSPAPQHPSAAGTTTGTPSIRTHLVSVWRPATPSPPWRYAEPAETIPEPTGCRSRMRLAAIQQNSLSRSLVSYANNDCFFCTYFYKMSKNTERICNFNFKKVC